MRQIYPQGRGASPNRSHSGPNAPAPVSRCRRLLVRLLLPLWGVSCAGPLEVDGESNALGAAASLRLDVEVGGGGGTRGTVVLDSASSRFTQTCTSGIPSQCAGLRVARASVAGSPAPITTALFSATRTDAFRRLKASYPWELEVAPPGSVQLTIVANARQRTIRFEGLTAPNATLADFLTRFLDAAEAAAGAKVP